MDEAAKSNAAEASWACAECGWPEPELIEIRSFDDVRGGHLVEAERGESAR